MVTSISIATQAATSLSADLGTGTVPSTTPPSAPPDEVTALRSAAASLGSSTQAATTNLIPGCVTSAHPAEVKGLTDLNAAVAGFGKVVTGAGSGDYGTAQREMQAAIAALQSGSAEMTTAIVELGKYGTR